MYNYDWFMLMLDKKQNFVKQVSFNKKWINLQKNYLLDFLVLFLPYKSIIIYHYSQLFFAIFEPFFILFSHGNDVQQVATRIYTCNGITGFGNGFRKKRQSISLKKAVTMPYNICLIITDSPTHKQYHTGHIQNRKMVSNE